MKKFKKFTIVFFITFIILFVLYSVFFYKSYYGKRPCDQPYSQWISEDGQITFSIDENGAGTGVILIDNEKINIHIGIGPATEFKIYTLESVKGNVRTERFFEYWVGDFREYDNFTATVKETTYFNVGDEITFYRIGDYPKESLKSRFP